VDLVDTDPEHYEVSSIQDGLYNSLIFSRLYLPQGTAEGSMVLKKQTEAATGDIKVFHFIFVLWTYG
jgi:hypothetical protein